MSKTAIQQRIAHYEQLKARFLRSGSSVQVQFAAKSISELKRRLSSARN